MMLTPGKRKYERLSKRKVKYIVRHKIRDKSTRSIALEMRVPYLHCKVQAACRIAWDKADTNEY
ncbi:MAG: hypothetical protein C5S38_03810 [Candidatus Methanophagaceae archaeon]|nr:MAG: hypothetical protein C5S38_03810 [Methanophagales archaeon]